jgi:hypothetical protein
VKKFPAFGFGVLPISRGKIPCPTSVKKNAGFYSSYTLVMEVVFLVFSIIGILFFSMVLA